MCSLLLTVDSLRKLESAYRRNLPKHIVIHSTIKLFIARFKKFPELVDRFKLLALSDNWENDGSFFATVSSAD